MLEDDLERASAQRFEAKRTVSGVEASTAIENNVDLREGGARGGGLGGRI